MALAREVQASMQMKFIYNQVLTMMMSSKMNRTALVEVRFATMRLSLTSSNGMPRSETVNEFGPHSAYLWSFMSS